MYKVAERGNRNGVLWASASLGVMIGIIQLTGGRLLPFLATLVIMIVVMTIANCFHDPSMS